MLINLIGPINSLGYGLCTLNILKQLSKKGDVSYFPIGQPQDVDSQDIPLLQQAIKNAENFNPSSPTLKIWHQYDLSMRLAGNGSYNCLSFFEVDFSPRDIKNVKLCDKFLVSCKWAQDIASQYRDNVHVVNMGVDNTIFNPSVVGKKYDEFVIMILGKFEHRKNIDKAILAFHKAFDTKDLVRLHLHTHNPFLNQQELNWWERLCYDGKLASKIWILPRSSSHKDVAKKIASANLGLFISSSESWDMGAVEFLAMNKHIICSNVTAHKEYATQQNSILLEMGKMVPARDNKWFFHGEWAEFGDEQESQLIEQLRSAYRKWKESPEDFVNPNDIGVRFSWDKTADRILELI